MSERLQAGMKLVVASHNKGKVWEIKQLIAPFGLDAVSAGDLDLDEPEETEATFVGNARLKAEAAAKVSGLPALADDSGLEVDILDGAPGIYSARWAGPTKDFSIAMGRVAEEVSALDGWPVPRANFICVMCLAWPNGDWETFEGRVDGHLVWPVRGGNGFGYDPMFVPEGGVATFGEMEPDEKYAISHRTRAFAAFKADCLDGMEGASPGGVAGGAVVAIDAGLDALTAAAANISTREELVTFVGNLAADLKDNPGNWDEPTLERYLHAMQAWLAEGAIADEPVWRTMAKSLLAARGSGS